MVLVRLVVVVCLVLVAPSWATAQVFEWTDASGSRHYTNDPEDIPEAQREEARVVVRGRRPAEAEVQQSASVEQASPRSVEAEPSSGRAVREERLLDADRSRIRRERRQRRREYGDTQPRSREGAPIRQAQVVYDRSRERVVVPPPPPPAVVQDVHVNVSVPTTVVSQVVVETNSQGPYGYGPYDSSYGPYYSPYYGPAVSTSFDRGRSRHRTVRMSLQEQFQYDRDGPYVYLPRRVPLGPVFHTSLPRGLARGRAASPACSAMPRTQKNASRKMR